MEQQPLPENFLFIINPIAGDIDKQHLPEEIKKLCSQRSVCHDIYETTGKDDQTEVAEVINSFKPDVVVVVGGDGTVNMVSRVLINTSITMGIIPKGSGNGLAKDLKIPLNYQDAIKVIFEMNILQMDTLMINDHPSFHISDIGFNARVVDRFSKKKRRGQLTYALSLFQEYFSYKPKRYKIVTPQITYEDNALLVAIANANQFGSNTTINPIGEVDDGQFEISILNKFPYLHGIAVFWRLLRNRIHSSRYSKLIKCSEAVIYNMDGENVQIDGEPVPPFDRLEIKLLPHSLRIIVPKSR